ncbi:MAG TPA: VOC family protein [Steroidobacteraceae bacterium]|nr:VOC family protein [Steroidobacteraceae bacterium]
MSERRHRNLERRCAHGLLSTLVLCAASTLARAAPVDELPPLTVPASQAEYPGKMVWAELVTPDLPGCERFYASLFGWTFSDLRLGRTTYSLARLDGEPVAGLIGRSLPRGERRHPAWLTFLSVRSVPAAERAVIAHRGRVLVEPRRYPQRGEQAVFADPQGAVFAVLHSASGDPPDLLAAPGQWIWSVLLTADTEAAASFYRGVLDYRIYAVPSEGAATHFVLASDRYARAALDPLPADGRERHPHWLDFVRVTDVEAAVKRATALGGRVLVAPRVDRHGGRLALIADPAGAAIGVLEWSQSSETGSVK